MSASVPPSSPARGCWRSRSRRSPMRSCPSGWRRATAAPRAIGRLCSSGRRMPDPGPPGSRADLPIAVFDSGVGGLTVLHECLVSLPEEDYVYLGDDARFPYGARPAAELRRHVEQISRYLLERGAKLLVIACNSAASAGQETAREAAAEAG